MGQSEGNNHTSKINFFPRSHAIIFTWGPSNVFLSTQRAMKCTLWPTSKKKTFILIVWLLSSICSAIKLYTREINFFFLVAQYTNSFKLTEEWSIFNLSQFYENITPKSFIYVFWWIPRQKCLKVEMKFDNLLNLLFINSWIYIIIWRCHVHRHAET